MRSYNKIPKSELEEKYVADVINYEIEHHRMQVARYLFGVKTDNLCELLDGATKLGSKKDIRFMLEQFLGQCEGFDAMELMPNEFNAVKYDCIADTMCEKVFNKHLIGNKQDFIRGIQNIKDTKMLEQQKLQLLFQLFNSGIAKVNEYIHDTLDNETITSGELQMAAKNIQYSFSCVLSKAEWHYRFYK